MYCFINQEKNGCLEYETCVEMGDWKPDQSTTLGL